jgi:hypothetical protein
MGVIKGLKVTKALFVIGWFSVGRAFQLGVMEEQFRLVLK